MIAKIWAHLTKGVRDEAYDCGYDDGYRTRDRRAANICLASRGSTEREKAYARRRVYV